MKSKELNLNDANWDTRGMNKMIGKFESEVRTSIMGGFTRMMGYLSGNDSGRPRVLMGVALVLVTAMALVMGPVGSADAALVDGRVLYSNNTTTPQGRSYAASTNTFAAGAASLAGAAQSFMVQRAAPTRKEYIAGYVTTGGVLYVLRWNGTAWSAEWNVTVGGNGVDGRRFDIAYEKTSGRAVVVYSTNATGATGNEMAYRIWDGATWTAATNINSTTFSAAAAVTWIKMKSRPTSGSNEIAMTAVTSGTTTANTAVINTFTWSGTAWSESATAHATNLTNTTGQLVQNDMFDLAYESLTGDLIVVYTNSAPQQNYITRTAAGAWGTATSLATARALPIQMVAESNPEGDQVLILFNRGAAASDISGCVWNGTAMSAVTAIGTNGVTTAIEKKHVTAKWLNLGATDYAVAVWNSSTAGTLGYNTYNTTTTTWGTAATYVTGTGATANWLDSDWDHVGTDTMMVTFSTGAATTGSLWAKRLVVTAGPTFTWTNADGGTALSTTLASATSQNFAFTFDERYYSTATCDSCHGNPPADGPRSASTRATPGSHGKHVITRGMACTACHIDNGTAGSAYPQGLGHREGLIEMLATIGVTGSYAGGTSHAQASTPTLSACTNTTCHSDGTRVATGTTAANTSPAWGGTAACNACHGVGGPATGAPTYANLKKNVGAGTGTGWTATPSGTVTANVTTSDNLWAQSILTNQAYLYATMSGQAYTTGEVPDTVTILGIMAVIDGNGASATAANRQIRVALTKTGAAVAGTPKTAVQLPQTTDAEVVVGTGITDLWGTTWTPAEVRAATFGVAISDNDVTGGAGNEIRIDRVTVIVFTSAAPKANSHAKHTQSCVTCHSTVTDGTAIISQSLHNNGAYEVVQGGGQTFTYTYNANGGTCGTGSCHTTSPRWGISSVSMTCVDCHGSPISSPTANGLQAGVSTRRAIVPEFKTAWSHTASTNATPASRTVSNVDCAVCHMEGNIADGSPNTSTSPSGGQYHKNGYIELRDPDTGTTIMQATHNGSNPGAYTSNTTPATFVQFSRNLNSNALEIPARSIMINQCLKCHDAVGVGNAGTIPTGQTATSPFSGTASVVDVTASFTTTNSSYHPILGKQNNSYVQGARTYAPWNMSKTTGNTTSWGYLMTCWDCHAPSGTASTVTLTGTVTAHGGASTIRGTSYVTGTASTSNKVTLCIYCHQGYDTTGTFAAHNTGSAFTEDTGRQEKEPYLQYGCNVCHGSNYASAPARPTRAADVHGFNGNWTYTGFTNNKQWSFIRNMTTLRSHTPLSGNTSGTTSRTCVGMWCTSTTTRTETYTPGGAY